MLAHRRAADPLQRLPEEGRLVVDEVGVSVADGLEVCALSGRLGRIAPPLLDEGAQTRFLKDRDLVLVDGAAQDLQHLSRPSCAGGHERVVRRRELFAGDLLGRRDAGGGQRISVVVGVSEQIDRLHGSSSSGDQTTFAATPQPVCYPSTTTEKPLAGTALRGSYATYLTAIVARSGNPPKSWFSE